ncbi:hypothetical protein BN14_10844 [Rhizoctonia solani AG-1 IB]|uniref:Uncharacterized protein n=1 Tax=Thanatephorus cucumeris (strain AG1-IB / isolate 7/3/14) TaxID=1108050 RepID=M5CB96_THACB|nr:hypothetical protein BN14_10844 [Rhizoctonia solani AG-1 IB]
MTIDQLRFDPSQPPPVASASPETETVAGLAYRILVEKESDVLLFVCALIRNRSKVICYMNCSIPAFHMYKKIINDVTGIPVYTITKISTTEITQVGQTFLEADRSILLLPETITPSIEIDDLDSWVIHVGWPSDEQRYGEQRLIHQAQNSIVVACSEDENLYPAGASIMWQSQAWPRDVDSFRASVALLRPVFDQTLASIPAEMKAKIYPDWISCHGSRGHRFVSSWDVVTLVTKANSFLLDVLKYQAPSLPEVSEGFMAHNGLELAVQEGALRVKVPGSGINHASSLPKNDWVPAESERSLGPPSASTSTNPTRNLNNNSRNTNRPDYSDNVSVASTPSARAAQPKFGGTKPTVDQGPKFKPVNRPPAVGSSSTHNAFKITPGNTYLAVDDEFDAIPLMCFLAGTCGPDSRRAVFFIDTSGCQLHYQKLISRITEWTVFAPAIAETFQSTEDAALKFSRFPGPAILLLPFKIQTPPSVLTNVLLGCCVYWGSTLGGFVPLLQAKRHATALKCSSTSIIMTTAQRDKILPILYNSNFRVHPSSADLLHRDASSWLSEPRKTTKLVLSTEPELVKELYETHLRFFARTSRGQLGAEEIANRINKYTANVLLAGNPEDGSKRHPPISSRLLTPLSIVSDFDLQAAVDVGKLHVW